MRLLRFLIPWFGAPVLTTPSSRVFVVQSETRAFSVTAEPRVFYVSAESRVFTV